MKTTRSCDLWLPILVFLTCLTAVTPVSAQVVETDVLQRKQEDQQRARTLTRELVGGVLDIQLRQLEENGLTDQETYRDIKLMRQNLNHLVETEMSHVVDLLSETQRMPKEKREASFTEARQQIRTIVRQLAIERRNLLKRLKIAELAEQVHRLIRQQSVVQTATRRLPQEQQSRQETLTLKAIEDQRDVKELFLQLADTMIDMKSWSGMLAATAADGLRIVKAAEVEIHLDEASRSLQAVKYNSAFDEQDQALKGLMKLLAIIERAQGALNSERMAATERIRALTEKQKQLRDETSKLPDNVQPSSELVEQQSQLQNEIAKLQEMLRNNPKAEPLIQQAETASLEAAANLLDNKRDEAQANQGRVLSNLAALEILIKEPAAEQSRDKSADELTQMVQNLNQTKAQLIEAKQKQEQATATAKENAQESAPKAKEAADILQQTNSDSERPAAVETALTEAREATAQSAKLLESAALEKATAVEERALQLADNAIARAIKAVDAALAETQRLQSAIKIGELARAAEVLERAAAEERVVAKDVNAMARSADLKNADVAQQAKDLAERQDHLKAIAEKTAQAIANTAPQAAQHALEGAQQADQSGQNLQKLTNDPKNEPQLAAKQAADSAMNAAQKLSDSAKLIRDEIVSTAKAFAERSAVQAEQLTESRKAIEQAVDRLPSNDPVAQLESAKEKLNEAMQEQAKAQGKPESALAMRLTNQIASALDSQDAAMAAALAAEAGIGSELKATALQEEVAEKSQSAAEMAAKRPQAAAKNSNKPDPLTQALNEANQAASKAAKQTLDGDQTAAQTSRKTADESLKKALSIAQSEATAAANAPPTTQPEPQSQAKAALSVAQAQQLAANASTKAGNELAPAVTAAEAANQALSANSNQAPTAQSKSAEAMRDAQKSLDAAIQAAAAEQAKSLAEQSALDAALANRVAGVDLSTADAVDRAASAARLGSQANESPRRMTTAGKIAESALENAVANLGAKEQEVHRDRDVAQSIANLALDQQAASNRIMQHAAELEERMSKRNEGDQPTKEIQMAAKKLNEAQQQFAESQRATGQGAVELSGQSEVANLPLRDALELASDLLPKEMPANFLADDTLPDQQMIAARDKTDSADDQEAGQEIAKQLASSEQADNLADGQSQRKPAQPGSAADKANSLGTGFVPSSPELTAEMMAGPKAQSEARKILGKVPVEKGDLSDKSASSKTPNDSELDSEFNDQRGNSSRLGQKSATNSANQKVKDGATEKLPEGSSTMKPVPGQSREAEEGIQARQNKEEAWFAKLPPELRKSIRSGAAQKPPRAYEERLKKYFQSVD